MTRRTPSELPRPVRYFHADEEVRVGDRVESRFLIRRKQGRVSYVPGISPKHPELEFNGLTWVAIDFDDGTRTGVIVDPESFLLKKTVRLISRGPEGAKSIQPHEPFDE